MTRLIKILIIITAIMILNSCTDVQPNIQQYIECFPIDYPCTI